MHRGYTKRWRKRWDKGYHLDPLLWILMDYFIDHANYRDTEIYFPNFGIIPLKRGEHVFSIRKLSAFMQVDRQRIRTKLKMLENIEFLTRQVTRRFTKIYVINYDIYQDSEKATNPQTNPPLTHRKPTANPQLTLDKKEEYIKRKKKHVNKSKFEAVGLPDSKNIELLKDMSEPRILADIHLVCHHLTTEKIFTDAVTFTNAKLKAQKNPRAILHALSRCYLKKKFKKTPWSYCEQIMQVENQNYNEREMIAKAEYQKRELQKLFDGGET